MTRKTLKHAVAHQVMAICATLTLITALPMATANAQANVNNGFYFGLLLAGVFAEQDVMEITDPGPPPTYEVGTAELDSVGGTLAIGFRAPISGNIIGGIEADVTAGNFEDHYDGDDYDSDYIATLRAILGFQVNASTLLYLTGGVAFMDARYTGFVMPPAMAPPAVVNETLTGFTAGGGAEFDIGMGGVNVRAQYLYASFEDWKFWANGDYYDVETDTHIAQIGFVIPFPN